MYQMTNKLEKLSHAISLAVVRIVDEELRRYRELDFKEENKGEQDLVTVADRTIESRLATTLTNLLPDSTARGEEGVSETAVGQYEWVLDPIDGTVNFARGVSLFSSSIALLSEGTPVLSVVYIPSESTVTVAVKGSGTRQLNIHSGGGIEHTLSLTAAMRSTEYALYTIMITPKLRQSARESSLQFANWTLDHGLGFRVFVGQAYEAVKLAEGGIAAVLSFDSSGGWTRDACRLLCEETGGVYAVIRNTNNPKITGFVLAASKTLLESLTEPLAVVGYGVEKTP